MLSHSPMASHAEGGEARRATRILGCRSCAPALSWRHRTLGLLALVVVVAYVLVMVDIEAIMGHHESGLRWWRAPAGRNCSAKKAAKPKRPFADPPPPQPEGERVCLPPPPIRRGASAGGAKDATRPLIAVMMGVSGSDAGKGLSLEYERLVKSLLLTASCAFRMVVVADDTMSAVVEQVRHELCLDVGDVDRAQGRVEIGTQRLTNEQIVAEWAALGVDIRHHAGPFTQAKYSLEKLFPSEDAVLVLDTDMVFFDDVCRLWDESEALLHEGEGLVSAVVTGSGNHSINAGASYMRPDRMREVGWSTAVVEETKNTTGCLEFDAATNTYFGPHGDQNFLICAVQNHPQWFRPMRLRWNLTRCTVFEDVRFGSRGPGMLYSLGAIHNNCRSAPVSFELETFRLDSLSLNQLQEHTYRGRGA
jgi:hypothetical protein